jgi:hypothetical protein
MSYRTAQLALLLGALALVPASASPLDLLVSPLPSPTDVIGVLDALTKKDSSTSVDVKVGATVSQGKLLIARTSVNVAMERSSRNWRGSVLVTMIVPTEISYSINLADIRTEHVRLDPKRRALVVTMPKPRVEDVTPQLANLEADSKFKRGRFKRLDADTGRALQNEMLRHDYQARARQEGEGRAEAVREQGRKVLQGFLEKLLRGSAPGVRVIVE